MRSLKNAACFLIFILWGGRVSLSVIQVSVLNRRRLLQNFLEHPQALAVLKPRVWEFSHKTAFQCLR